MTRVTDDSLPEVDTLALDTTNGDDPARLEQVGVDERLYPVQAKQARTSLGET